MKNLIDLLTGWLRLEVTIGEGPIWRFLKHRNAYFAAILYPIVFFFAFILTFETNVFEYHLQDDESQRSGQI